MSGQAEIQRLQALRINGAFPLCRTCVSRFAGSTAESRRVQPFPDACRAPRTTARMTGSRNVIRLRAPRGSRSHRDRARVRRCRCCEGPGTLRQQDARAITCVQSLEPGCSDVAPSRRCRAREAVPLIVVCLRAPVTARAGARVRCRRPRCTCRCAGQAPRCPLAARLANNSPTMRGAPPQRLRATYPQTCHRFIHTRCG